MCSSGLLAGENNYPVPFSSFGTGVCWPQKKKKLHLEVFCPLPFFGKVREGQVLSFSLSVEFTSDAICSWDFLCWEVFDD